MDEMTWEWQGFEAPNDIAAACKAITDFDARAGVWVPDKGEPPMLWNKAGTRSIWAVQTRVGAPIPTPEGCEEIKSDMVGRLVNA